MKKWVLLVLAILTLCVPVLAEGLPLVVDDAALLTRDEAAQLSLEAEKLSKEFGMDVVIHTTGSLGVKTALDYAADYYDERGYGQGASSDGVMLVLSMEERDWCILTTGRGISAFTDYGIDLISDDIVPYFSKGEYAAGFSRFLRDARIYLEQAQTGRPYDIGNPARLKAPMERALGVAPYLAIAAAFISAVVLIIMILGMKTARPQFNANQYIREGAVNIARAQDIFLYHTESRVRIERETSSGGGGSSTFTSSSGNTHGGRSGKF